MTWKWALLIVLGILASTWAVWGFLKAINGIWFEIETLMRTIGEH